MKVLSLLFIAVPLLAACLALALAISSLTLGVAWWSVVLLWASFPVLVLGCVKAFGVVLHRSYLAEARAKGLEPKVDGQWLRTHRNQGIAFTLIGLICFTLGWAMGGAALTSSLVAIVSG